MAPHHPRSLPSPVEPRKRRRKKRAGRHKKTYLQLHLGALEDSDFDFDAEADQSDNDLPAALWAAAGTTDDGGVLLPTGINLHQYAFA